jgi:hypothetical protein
LLMGLGFQKLVYCAPFPSAILQLFYDDTLKNLTNTHASIAFFLSFFLSLLLLNEPTNIHSAPWPHHLLSSSRNDLIRSFGLSLPAVPIWLLRNIAYFFFFLYYSLFAHSFQTSDRPSGRPSSKRWKRLRGKWKKKNKRRTRTRRLRSASSWSSQFSC